MQFLSSARIQRTSPPKKGIGWIILLVALFFMGLTSIISSPVYAAPTATSAQTTYVDKRLGFNLQLPKGWVAAPHTSIHNTNNADVIFTNTKLPGTSLEINVMRSSSAASSFMRQGKPMLHIGGYPAFSMDTHAGQQVPVPCLVRVMLVHNDIVSASWCAKDATKHKQIFEGILASYHDRSATSLKSSIAAQSQSMAHSPLTCQQLINSGQNNPPHTAYTTPSDEWGTQQVSPTDSTWTNNFGEGVAVCDNYYSTGGCEWGDSISNTACNSYSYLFQCVELASRFVYEEWNMPAFNVDAYEYYDYYQGGTRYNGIARESAYQAQLIDDASQGNNSAPPVPGDLLIFQDVNDGVHWTSGEISGDPGHVVVVTSVTSNTVNVVQENWKHAETHSFTLQHLSNGYHVVDNSFWSGRITRGWIHFSANGGSSSSGSSGSGATQSQAFTSVGANPDGRLEVFARGTDNNIYHIWQGVPGDNWQAAWAEFPTTIQFAGDPVVAPNWDGHLEVFARGTDNNIYHIWQTSPGGHWTTTWAEFPTTIQFAGDPEVAANPDGRLEVFARGSDNNIYHIWQGVPGNNWQAAWVALATTPQFAGNPTVDANWDGHLEVFARGTDNNIYHIWQTSPGGHWQTAWAEFPTTVSFAGNPFVAANPDGRLEVFARGTDNNIYHIWQGVPGNNWQAAWVALATTPQFAGDPTAAANPDGHLEVFARGTDNNIYHIWQTSPGGHWEAAWVEFPTTVSFAGNPAVGANWDGHLEAFTLGTDNNIYHIWQVSPGGDWESAWAEFPTGSFQP